MHERHVSPSRAASAEGWPWRSSSPRERTCSLLDEPTNHLDLESREALEAALDAFLGTVLIVSHDRALLDAIADRTLAIEDGTIRSYDGGWAEYVAARDERAKPAEPEPSLKPKDEEGEAPPKPAADASWPRSRPTSRAVKRRSRTSSSSSPRTGRTWTSSRPTAARETIFSRCSPAGSGSSSARAVDLRGHSPGGAGESGRWMTACARGDRAACRTVERCRVHGSGRWNPAVSHHTVTC